VLVNICKLFNLIRFDTTLWSLHFSPQSSLNYSIQTKNKFISIFRNRKLTERTVGPTWDVRSCFRGPPARNSSLGVIIQNPTGGFSDIQPCTLLSLFSHEYWYLSSTFQVPSNKHYKQNCHSNICCKKRKEKGSSGSITK